MAAAVVKNISLVNNTATGSWTSTDASQPLTDLLLKELVKGKLYLNAHTSANPGGEIRGQVVGSTGLATAVEQVKDAGIPSAFRLDQNYPNPFNPSTVISFEIAKSAHVTLRIYNILGELMTTLVDGVKQPGVYRTTLQASSLSSGVYFYSLAADGATIQTKKMLLLR